MADGGLWLKGGPLQGISQRLPPANLRAEQSLLGAILANNRAFEKVVDVVQAIHFADSVHAVIFKHISDRIMDGYLADGVTMQAVLNNNGVLDAVGGTAYLAELLSSMVGIINAREYALTVVDCWLRRQLIEVGEDIVNTAFGADSDLSAEDIVRRAEGAISDLRRSSNRTEWIGGVGDCVSAAASHAEAIYRGGSTGQFMTGFSALDDVFDLQPGDFTIVGGLPGAGKSAFAIQIGVERAKQILASAMGTGMTPERAYREPGVAFLSLEMSKLQLGQRVLAYEAHVGVQDLRKGTLDEAAWERVRRAEIALKYVPLRIWEGRGMPLRMLAPKLRTHLRRQPELAAFIDNLTLIKDDESVGGKRWGNETQEVDRAAAGFLQLARDLQIPIVVLAHLSRPPKSSMGSTVVPRPQKQDLANAGEKHADNVLFVHRPIQQMPDQAPVQGKENGSAFMKRLDEWHTARDRARELAEIVIAKQRMGPEGCVSLRWIGRTTSFASLHRSVVTQEEIPPHI